MTLPRIEKPGPWYFPPLATAVTSTARLLLHLAIQTVHAAGGVVAYWDTDSVFVVATPEGGMIRFPGGTELTEDGKEGIRALPFSQVRRVRSRIDELIPFADVLATHADAPGPNNLWVRRREPGALRVEPENWLRPAGFQRDVQFAGRASKRYCVYWLEPPGQHVELQPDGKPIVVDPTPDEIRRLTKISVVRPSKHGLPYMAPRKDSQWVEKGLEHLLRLEHGFPTEQPAWWNGPAIALIPAARPDIVSFNPKPRPFSPLAVLHVPLLGPVVAPWHDGFDPHGATWRTLSGEEMNLTPPEGGLDGETLGQALARVWGSVDRAAVDARGLPLTARSAGLVRPAPAVATEIRNLGKGSRHAGIGREVLTGPQHADYGGVDYWPDVLRALALFAQESRYRADIAQEAGISIRWLDEIRSGRRQPSPETRTRLAAVLARRAAHWMSEALPSGSLPGTEAGILSQYLELSPVPARRCHQCDRLLVRRQRYWCSDTCRKKYERRQVTQPQLPLSQD
jgi:transcriptional regulator with XRE-family HTH domain